MAAKIRVALGISKTKIVANNQAIIAQKVEREPVHFQTVKKIDFLQRALG